MFVFFILLVCFSSIFAVFYTLIPIIHSYLFKKRKTIASKTKQDIQEIIDNFLNNDNAGKYFVELILNNEFMCLKSGNHGGDFPDLKQYSNFVRYSNLDVANALKEVGDLYEKSIL